MKPGENAMTAVGSPGGVLMDWWGEIIRRHPSQTRTVREARAMNPQGSVTRLVRDLRSDNSAVRNTAAQLIWQRYFQALLELARRNLDKRIRRRADEEDVLQSMFKSFCLRQQRGEFDLADRDALWKLLVVITIRKACNLANRHRRGVRDVRREKATAPAADDESGCPRWALEQMDAAVPTPAEAVVLNEALECRFRALPDPELRQIAVWKLEGWTNVEIADRLGYVERTVERKLERIRSKWMSFDDGTP
jgi:RNA polymerase sigma factor (sigma-70 family)